LIAFTESATNRESQSADYGTVRATDNLFSGTPGISPPVGRNAEGEMNFAAEIKQE
jgi:hypothetical protein